MESSKAAQSLNRFGAGHGFVVSRSTVCLGKLSSAYSSSSSKVGRLRISEIRMDWRMVLGLPNKLNKSTANWDLSGPSTVAVSSSVIGLADLLSQTTGILGHVRNNDRLANMLRYRFTLFLLAFGWSRRCFGRSHMFFSGIRIFSWRSRLRCQSLFGWRLTGRLGRPRSRGSLGRHRATASLILLTTLGSPSKKFFNVSGHRVPKK